MDRNATSSDARPWQEKREIQYWTRLLNVTEPEARKLAETMNKRVVSPLTPESNATRSRPP